MSDVPFELAGFEPLSRIGGGGFGEVWAARQTNIDRKVAIKVGHAPIDDKTVQLRFERECIALGRLSGHPNIIDVFTAGRLEDGRPYLVLEYVGGGTLWQRLQRGAIDEAQLRKIGIELADALRVAHEAGVMHRDLKPENVLLRENGQAVLGDFGIARLHDGAHTTSHAITASVAYAAPEVLSGKSATASSDIYGIGICLLAGILRSVPFVEKTDESIHPIINRVLSDRPPDLTQHGISPGFAQIVNSLLEKNPDKRPPSAEAVQNRLQATAQPPPPSGPNPGAVAPAANPTQVLNQQFDTPATAQPQQIPANTGQQPLGQVSRAEPGPILGGPGQGPGPPVPPAQTPSTGHPTPADLGRYAPPTARPATDAGAPVIGLQSQPYAASTASYGSGPKVRTGGDKIRIFGAAFGATLLLGGLLIFAIIRLNDDDDGGGETSTEDTTTSTVEPPTANPLVDPGDSDTDGDLDGDADADVDPDADSTLTAETEALFIPLTAQDLRFPADASNTPDLVGLNSPQFCDNTPFAPGLDEEIGQTIGDPAGFPLVFQQVARFETETNAIAYVSSYLATIDCDEWVLPGEAGDPSIVIAPSVVPAQVVHGDDTREISFTGDADIVTVFGRAAVVRDVAEVYIVSITSIEESDLADLDGWLAVAIERLGF